MRFEKSGSYDLKIHIGSETILLDNQVRSDYQNNTSYDHAQIESLVLDDSTIIDLTSGLSFVGTSGNDSIQGYANHANDLYGLGGNDYLYGGSAADILNGGVGNDQLYGYAGDDTYIWSVGDGNDVINETGGSDELVLHGVNVGDLRFEKSGSYDLKIHIGSETILLDNQVRSDYQNNTSYDHAQIESLVLDDSTIIDLTGGLSFVGTASNDSIQGYANHVNNLYGLDGNDYLYGGSVADTLEGGAGADTLYGYAGNDSYIWSVGDGNDIINETGGSDELVLHGVNVGDLRFEKSGSYDLKIHIGSETILLDNQVRSDYQNNTSYDHAQIESLVLDDSTIIDLTGGLSFVGTASNDSIQGYANHVNDLYGLDGNDYLYGGSAADILNGGVGNDQLYGYAGNDSYIWSVGDGNDVINETGGSDQLVLHGINVNDLRFEKSGSYDLKIHIGSETILLDNQVRSDYQNNTSYDHAQIESLVLDDSTIIDLTSGLSFVGTSGNDSIQGYANHANDLYGLGGNDYIYGGSADDIIVGGDGIDNLYGYDGADTFVFEADSAFNNTDVIKDYNAVDGDVINIVDLLTSYDPMQHAIDDFVILTETSGDTIISVDRDGTGTTYTAQDVVNVDNVTGLDLDDMITNGELLVA